MINTFIITLATTTKLLYRIHHLKMTPKLLTSNRHHSRLHWIRNRGVMSLLLLLLGCNGSTKAWEAPIEPIVGIANIDDDNQDGRADWDSDVSESENDFTTFELPQEMKDAVGKNNSVRSRQNDNGFRIYIDGVLKSIRRRPLCFRLCCPS